MQRSNMKVGDLVQMKDTCSHKEIGVVIKTIPQQEGFKVHWADGRVLWERDKWIKAVKKCP